MEEGLEGKGPLLPKNNNNNNKDDSRNKILPSSSRVIRKCPVVCVESSLSPYAHVKSSRIYRFRISSPSLI